MDIDGVNAVINDTHRHEGHVIVILKQVKVLQDSAVECCSLREAIIPCRTDNFGFQNVMRVGVIKGSTKGGVSGASPMRFFLEFKTVRWEVHARAKSAEVVTKCSCKLEDLFLARLQLQQGCLDS